MTALSALAAAIIAPPQQGDLPPELAPFVLQACAGAWRAVEVVFAGDVLRGRVGKTRDSIVREAVDGVFALFGNVGIRADALAGLRAARDAGALEGELDIAAIVADVREHGAVAVGRAAITEIRRSLADHRDLEAALGDHEIASLLIDTARACFRHAAREPHLAAWAIGPTGSPGRDRALAAFAELAASPDSLAELESLIALPIHLDENVQFTVYRPRTIDPGKWHQLLAFAHLAERRVGEDDLPDPVEEVQRQAAQVLGPKAAQYQPVVQDSGSAIPEEGELTFVPEFPGIEVNPPRRSFLWLEPVHREEFRIRAGRELDGKTVRGRLTVFLGHIAIAEVALSVRVDTARPEPRKREPQTARVYRRIFASYSHRDADIVNQFETYARALGDEYLRDWVHLRTGEVWTDRLCQLIDQADAFQLFWSRNSMHSQFVRQEYEYALSLNRPSFVRPTYWEEPMPTAPGLPPESLLRLHFQKLGAEMITVGAGSRSERKKQAPLSGAMVVERERADDNTAKHLAREVAGANAEHELDAADSFSDTRADVHAIAPEPDDVTDPGVVLPPPRGACAHCGTVNPSSAAFCQSCGHQLGGEPAKRRTPTEPAAATPLASRARAAPPRKEAAAPRREQAEAAPEAPSRRTAPRIARTPEAGTRASAATPTTPMQPAPPSDSWSDTATDTPRAPSAPIEETSSTISKRADFDTAHDADDMEYEPAPAPPPSSASRRAAPWPGMLSSSEPSSAPASEDGGSDDVGTSTSRRSAPRPGMPSLSAAAPSAPARTGATPPSSAAAPSAPARPTMPPISTPAPPSAAARSAGALPSVPKLPSILSPAASRPSQMPSQPRPASPSQPPVAQRPTPMPSQARPMPSPSTPPISQPDPASRPSPMPSQPRPVSPSQPPFASQPPMSQPRPAPMPSQPRPAPIVEERELEQRVASSPSPSPSPDSWTDEARPSKPALFPPGPGVRASAPVVKHEAAVDPSAPKLFPSEPRSSEPRSSESRSSEPRLPEIPDEQSITTTQPMSPPPPGRGLRSPSQAPPSQTPSTLPGVRADDLPARPSPMPGASLPSPALPSMPGTPPSGASMPLPAASPSGASMPSPSASMAASLSGAPVSSPAIVPPPSDTSSPAIAQPSDAIAPSPPNEPAPAPVVSSARSPWASPDGASATDLAMAPATDAAASADDLAAAPSAPAASAAPVAAPRPKTMMSANAVSPFAATMPQPALQASPEDLAHLDGAMKKAGPAGSANDVKMMKRLPNAPASGGWVLAVVITLIVVVAIVLLVLLT